MTDYVAIVKKCEGDIVYTVEGNTSTTVNGNSVRGSFFSTIFFWSFPIQFFKFVVKKAAVFVAYCMENVFCR